MPWRRLSPTRASRWRHIDSILEVAQNDPDVREKIRQRIRPSAQ
jgi:hypothetical protein